MKYLRIVIIVALSAVIMPSCDNEDTSGYNCTPEGCFADAANAQYLSLDDCVAACDNEGGGGGVSGMGDGEWYFNITIDGNLYAAAGDCFWYNYTNQTMGAASLAYSNLTIGLSLLDLSSENYISGGYLSLQLGIEEPYVGPNIATIDGTNDYLDYFSQYGDEGLIPQYPFFMNDNTTPPSSIGYYYGGGLWGGFDYYAFKNLPINITSLGTPFTTNSDPTLDCVYSGENLEGYYSGTVYLPDYSILPENPTAADIEMFANTPFSIPLELSIDFSVPRSY